MVSFDQAEGLRRMLAGSGPKIYSLLSATSGEEKGATLVNLAASLAQAGSKVLVLGLTGWMSAVGAVWNARRRALAV